MFFEDEKENIENNSDLQLSDEETTSWDILDDSADDLVSIKDAPKTESMEINDVDDNSDLASIDFGDELELIDDDIVSDEDDVDDEELTRILNSDDNISSKQRAFDAFGNGSAEKLEGDIIQEDSVENAELKESGTYGKGQPEPDFQPQDEIDADKEIYTEPKVQESKRQVSPLMLAMLFAVLVVAGVYFILNYTKDKGVNQDNLPVASDIQQTSQEVTENPIQQETTVQENIPVVNEENVDMIKPEVPEKKEIINVTPTGKANPFVPIQKYVKVAAPTTRYNYDAAGIPKPPLEYGEKDVTTTKLMTISVSGIMYDEIKPSAIITLDNNDYFVQKGDKLDDYKVVDITRSDVKIALGKNIYKANLGEEFKINSFYGNAEYISEKLGGGRQYHAVTESKGESSSSSRSSRRVKTRNQVKPPKYTSEQDVRIETYK